MEQNKDKFLKVRITEKELQEVKSVIGYSDEKTVSSFIRGSVIKTVNELKVNTPILNSQLELCGSSRLLYAIHNVELNFNPFKEENLKEEKLIEAYNSEVINQVEKEIITRLYYKTLAGEQMDQDIENMIKEIFIKIIGKK